ncbi:MAG: dipeptide epimerase [Nitrospirota bacterium]|nr:MAG: dipeptide epimerase [Nitrospirota bacterium]
MCSDDRLTIHKVEIWPVDIPLTDPFVVATGELGSAKNIFLRITLQGGSVGYGEIAPFPDVTGEDRASSFAKAKELAKAALGQSGGRYRKLAKVFQEIAPSHPAARCGLETALVDAVCRAGGLPLWSLWGGADVRSRETDITIPITDLDRTQTLVREWYGQGFRMFKMKVGKDVDQDLRRLESIQHSFSNVAFIVDSNQGFTREEALDFAKGVKRVGATIHLFEQPVPKNDLDSLAALRASLDIPIAADESVQTIEDLKAIIQHKAADFINIKITKSGLLEGAEMASLARMSGLRLMIGGMVETRVAMGCSFSLVLGLGGFEVLDLDTPLLLAQDPVEGGYDYVGPQLHPWGSSGLAMEVTPSAECLILEH